METLVEKARAYLEGLEVERQAALALSEQKAQEAELIKARQEGFRAAMGFLAGGASVHDIRSDRVENTGAEAKHNDPVQRRRRRPIRELILRELSFSGQPMTAAQIARAINYIPDRTETALERMESAGRVLRNEEGRWAIVLTKTNGHAATAGNGNPLDAPQRAAEVLQDQGC
jgi:hypothetical protein